MTREDVCRFCAKVPLVLSFTACVWVLGNVAGGAHSGGDEGTGFKVFWLLIAVQIPFLIGFVMTADWKRLRAVSGRIALQVAGLAVAFAPVAYFHL